MKQIERIINPEMNRNRFNEGMTSINALISTTVETYFDKLKSLYIRYSKHVPSPFLFELRDLHNLYISKIAIDFGHFYWLFLKPILIPNKSFPCPDDVSRSRTPCPEVFFQET